MTGDYWRLLETGDYWRSLMTAGDTTLPNVPLTRHLCNHIYHQSSSFMDLPHHVHSTLPAYTTSELCCAIFTFCKIAENHHVQSEAGVLYLAHCIIQVCSSSYQTSRLDKKSMQRPRKEYLVWLRELLEITGNYSRLLQIAAEYWRLQMRSKSKGFSQGSG